MTTQLTPAPAPDTTARRDHIYPALTVAQLARIATHGRRRRVEAGEVLVHAGEPVARLFVVVEGQIDGVRPSATQGDLVVSLGPGMFSYHAVGPPWARPYPGRGGRRGHRSRP